MGWTFNPFTGNLDNTGPSTSPAGSNTQIQFNDSGAFGADSVFVWDKTNKRLGVGNSSPSYRFHVSGSTAGTDNPIFAINNSTKTVCTISDYPSFRLIDYNSTVGFTFTPGDGQPRCTYEVANNFKLGKEGDTVNNNFWHLERVSSTRQDMLVRGYVGIGTHVGSAYSSPSASLEVKAPSTTVAALSLNTPSGFSTNSEILTIQDNGTTIGRVYGGGNISFSVASGSNRETVFREVTTGSSGTQYYSDWLCRLVGSGSAFDFWVGGLRWDGRNSKSKVDFLLNSQGTLSSNTYNTLYAAFTVDSNGDGATQFTLASASGGGGARESGIEMTANQTYTGGAQTAKHFIRGATQGNTNHYGVPMHIRASHAYQTGSGGLPGGSVFIYGGNASSGGLNGSVCLAHDQYNGVLGRVGIGTNAPDKILEVNLGTSDAVRFSYNDANGSATTYFDTTISSTGVVTFNSTGSSAGFTFSDNVIISTLTASRAVVTNGSSQLTSSATTATEIGYLSGVTSAIQTQLNTKLDGTLTATRVPFASDSNTLTDSDDLTWDNDGSLLTIVGPTITVDDAANPTSAQNGGGSDFTADGNTFNFSVFAYRAIGATTIYSQNGLGINFTDDSSTNPYSIDLGWDVVADADGYRVIIDTDPINGYAGDYYFDVATNSASYISGVTPTAGNTVTPKSVTGGVDVTGNVTTDVLDSTDAYTETFYIGTSLSSASYDFGADITNFQITTTTAGSKISLPGYAGGATPIFSIAGGVESGFGINTTSRGTDNKVLLSDIYGFGFIDQGHSWLLFDDRSGSSNYYNGIRLLVRSTGNVIQENGNFGLGTAAPSTKFHVISTSEPVRIGYNTTNYLSITIGSSGAVTLNSTGAGAAFNFSDVVQPTTNDGAALGTGTLKWSDLFLASGGVVDFNNGDVTVTHSSNLLTVAGGGLQVDGSLQCDSIVNDTGLAHGTYTPTRSAEANMDANVTMFEAQYMRVGNTVTVSGRFTADPTLTATATSFEMTLPVASNFGVVEDCAGVAFCGAIAGMGAQISGSVANNTMVVSWISSDTTAQSWSFTATYQVI